ncbi:ALF repeat-containing protein [Streptomyces sp. NBC_00237]|uniref:ALF repeat-containing protein n=1 Tax=Streptomyces sp. NBC_00237 TaxID=2975687 RepID=UPI002259727D|nr:ALF repeat-containing protein [Streptomyces sp. NBC_00237]MCX5206123.1 ALF repeat-containing protein [Streptomyces sp. NBC_00237]
MKKLARIPVLIATAALAPAVLLAAPEAIAADANTTAVTAPDAETKSTKQKEDDDRVEVFRILGAKDSGRGVKEAARAALDGGPEAIRQFLEKGQFTARQEDNRVRVAQIIHTGGPGVREAGRKALNGTAQDIQEFLDKGQHEARITDNRVRVGQIMSTGGPHVREAGKKALLGTPQDVEKFLATGQYEARKLDEATKDDSKDQTTGGNGSTGGRDSEKPQPKPDPAKDKETAANANGGSTTGAKPNTTGDAGSRAAGSTGEGSRPGGKDTASTQVTAAEGDLATTGTSPAIPWAIGGTVVALAAGAGLLLAARRRSAQN